MKVNRKELVRVAKHREAKTDECDGNGGQSCSSGWRKKRGGKIGCFIGKLHSKFR